MENDSSKARCTLSFCKLPNAVNHIIWELLLALLLKLTNSHRLVLVAIFDKFAIFAIFDFLYSLIKKSSKIARQAIQI